MSTTPHQQSAPTLARVRRQDDRAPTEGDCRREFARLRGTRLDPGVDRELPPMPFDPAFPAISELGWDAGWERVPEEFVGPVQLVLCGMRLKWVRVRARQFAPDPDAHYDGRPYYASDTGAHSGSRLARYPSDGEDLMRFRTY